MYKDGKPNNRLIRFLIRKIVCWLEEKAIRLDKKPSVSNHPFSGDTQQVMELLRK